MFKLKLFSGKVLAELMHVLMFTLRGYSQKVRNDHMNAACELKRAHFRAQGE